jgi:long-subunit acyl-CoA synthetase (AMP-forming)
LQRECIEQIHVANLRHDNGIAANDSEDPDKDALVLFTSGTSQEFPKGVRLSHLNILYQLDQLRQHNSVEWISSADRSLSLLPWSHCYGLIAECFSMMDRGASMTLFPPKFNLPLWIRQVLFEKPTVLFLVPKILYGFQEFDRQLLSHIASKTWRKRILFGPKIRYIVSGGAALHPETVDYLLHELNLSVYQGYGCTEMSPMISLEKEWQPSIQTEAGIPDGSNETYVGRLLPHIETMIDPQTSEFLVRGPTRFKGYLNEPPLQPEDWFRTGDVVSLVQDNKERQPRVFYQSRLAHQIKLPNGKFISLLNIEQYVRHKIFGDCSTPKDEVCIWYDPLCTPSFRGVGYSPNTLRSQMGHVPIISIKNDIQIRIVMLPHSFLSIDQGTMTMKGDIVRSKIRTLYSSSFG